MIDKERLEPLRGLTMASRSYAIADAEVRMPADGETRARFVGHASVTNRGYEMYGGPENGGWTEYVDQGAFRKTLRENPDVAFLVNHGGVTMARTKAGSLRLSEDKVGLRAEAEFDTRRPDVLTAVLALEGGELDEMSFAFRTTKQTWLNADGNEVAWWDLDGIERHIQEVDIHKGDVSIVNYGANPHTDASLRSLAEAVRSLTTADPDEVRAVIESLTAMLPADESPAIDPEILAPVEIHPDLVAAHYAAARLARPVY